MSVDPTAIEIKFDPRLQRMRGVAIHGDTPFDVPFITQITPTLWMGGCQDGLVAPVEIDHIFSLYPWERYSRHEHQTLTEIRMYDSVDQDLSQVWEIADRIIAAQLTGTVLVHCQAGLNRSGLVTAAVLIKEGSLPEVAIRRLQRLRSPAVLCNRSFQDFLRKGVSG